MGIITYLLGDTLEGQRVKQKNYRETKQHKETQKEEREYPDIQSCKYSYFHCLA